jgi:hypothetical protein
MTMRSSVLLLTLWGSAHADTLVLRNGTRVVGRWWATDGKVISLLVNDHLERYSQSEVSEVVFGAEPLASAVASPPPISTPPAKAINQSPIVARPGQVGAVYFQEESGNLLRLERAEGVPHRGSAIRRSGQYWDIQGSRSPFRLNSGSRMQFLVEMPSRIAPNAFSLYPLETKGSTRRTKAGTGNSLALAIPLTIRPATGNTYILAPVEPLAPGEYSFSAANTNDAYCFGVDRSR